MASIWLTYAWADDRDRDVEFAAQELVAAGLKVKLDRWNIQAGRRLWQQIEQFIQDEAECDAWLMYVTENSLEASHAGKSMPMLSTAHCSLVAISSR